MPYFLYFGLFLQQTLTQGSYTKTLGVLHYSRHFLQAIACSNGTVNMVTYKTINRKSKTCTPSYDIFSNHVAPNLSPALVDKIFVHFTIARLFSWVVLQRIARTNGTVNTVMSKKTDRKNKRFTSSYAILPTLSHADLRPALVDITFGHNILAPIFPSCSTNDCFNQSHSPCSSVQEPKWKTQLRSEVMPYIPKLLPSVRYNNIKNFDATPPFPRPAPLTIAWMRRISHTILS